MAESGSKRSDPRRRARARNPLAAFDPYDRCWCASGRVHKNCHQIRGLQRPGAPIPPDTEAEIFISPDTTVSRDAFTQQRGPVAITHQQPTPQAVPVTVVDVVAALAAAEPVAAPLTHGEIGRLRYALLDANGLTDPAAVLAGAHDRDLERLIPDLAHGALELGRATIDRLTADQALAEPPVILHSDVLDTRRLVGQTLFWADHYVTPDRLASAAAEGRAELMNYREPVAALLELRPLVEAGIVVPAFVDLALAVIGPDVDQMVAVDLADTEYVAWAEGQVVIEGPTAREAAFVHVVDHYQTDAWFYLLNRVVPGTAHQPNAEAVRLRGRMPNTYDPGHDYGPWLSTVKRQVIAQLTKQLDVDLAVAAAFGADLITGCPFRARALRRRSALPRTADHDVTGAVWAEVPWLPDAPAELLVKIASNEPRVDELRRATATALRTVEHGDVVGNAQAIADVAGDLSASAMRLGRDLRGQAALNLGASSGLATGSVLVAGTLAPPLALSGVLAGAAAAIPAARALLTSRRSAAYAFWMARPR